MTAHLYMSYEQQNTLKFLPQCNYTSILKISSENIDRQLSYILFGKLLSKIPFLACFDRK